MAVHYQSAVFVFETAGLAPVQTVVAEIVSMVQASRGQVLNFDSLSERVLTLRIAIAFSEFEGFAAAMNRGGEHFAPSDPCETRQITDGHRATLYGNVNIHIGVNVWSGPA